MSLTQLPLIELSSDVRPEFFVSLEARKEKMVINRCRFSGSALRPSDAKTASRLTHIGLAYHASWEMRLAPIGGSIVVGGPSEC
jgi:hypothetical protein